MMERAAGHPSTEELGRRYRAAWDRVERSHLQVVWLLRQGWSGREVAQVMGYSERWVTEIVRRYDEDGLAGLADRRHGNAGAKPLLDHAQREELAAALQGAPPQGRAVDRSQGGGLDRRRDRAGDPPATGLGLPAKARLHPQAPAAASWQSRRRGRSGVQKRVLGRFW